MKVWDPQGAAGGGRQTGHIAPVRGVALTNDGQRALSTAGDSSVAAWNAPAGEEIASARLYRIMFSDDEGMYCFQPALTGDGRFAAFVSIHELRNLGKIRREIQLADLQDGLAFHPLETIVDGASSQDAIWHFAAFAAGPARRSWFPVGRMRSRSGTAVPAKRFARCRKFPRGSGRRRSPSG